MDTDLDTTTQQLIEDWRTAAAAEAYFSASRVQGRLFDLYGVLDDGEGKRLVEAWLTLTIQRDLFSGAELLDMLGDLEARLAHPVSR